jgi:hypothetical protein
MLSAGPRFFHDSSMWWFSTASTHSNSNRNILPCVCVRRCVCAVVRVCGGACVRLVGAWREVMKGGGST